MAIDCCASTASQVRWRLTDGGRAGRSLTSAEQFRAPQAMASPLSARRATLRGFIPAPVPWGGTPPPPECHHNISLSDQAEGPIAECSSAHAAPASRRASSWLSQ